MLEFSTKPLQVFAHWFEEAQTCGLLEPTSVSLATVNSDGKPSVRIVLLKKFDESGFVFYTNLKSHKGNDIAINPNVALCFHWMPLQKQVRVEGVATQVIDEEADRYFASRDRDSQIGAWASIQSQTLEKKKELEDRFKFYNEKFQMKDIPRPNFWSGYLVRPEVIEFWEAGAHRLHSREVYRRLEVGSDWYVENLYP